MKNRSFSALLLGKLSLGNLSLGQTPSVAASSRWLSLGRSTLCGLLLAGVTLGLTACHSNLFLAYKFPVYPFADRPVPPSKLAQRVMIAVANVGVGAGTGTLAIVDAKRDIRSNIQNTVQTFSIGGFSDPMPTQIFNFPEEITGFVYAAGDHTLSTIDYGKETRNGTATVFPGASNSLAVPTDFMRVFSAEPANGQLVILDNSASTVTTATGSTTTTTTPRQYALNLPNVYQVASNVGDTLAIAMVRNSNTLYQVVKLNANQFLTAADATKPITAGGLNAVDCQPLNLPVYCVVPVPGNFDRPIGAFFTNDGATAYILNCGPECGGTTTSITVMQQGVLNINNVALYGSANGISNPAVGPNPPGYITNILVPGGATVATSDGTSLFVAGQQLQPDGLFAGNLTTIALSNNAITGTYSISDGTHTKMLFADNNTLWIGSQLCANGERAKLNQNYNCLTRFDLGALTASIVPNVTPGGTPTVSYPNTNLNPYYYGDLTGICWVQTFNKVYTAYGGQVHIFSTVDGSEIDNSLVTVQGTALDVAYMDALTNFDN